MTRNSATHKAVVIGGGLGGMAAALRLAAQGWQVTLCEAGPALGGKLNRHAAQGFTFDTGPSLITMPWIFEDLFRAAGADMSERLEIVPVRPLARYVYPDGTAFTFSTNAAEWGAAVSELEPRDVQGFYRIMSLGAKLYELSKATFLNQAPGEPPGPGMLRALRHFPLWRGWGNYANTVAHYLKSPYLRQLFNRYPTYVGSSPYHCPATFLLIPYLEWAFGGWYVMGGLYRIAEELEALLREHEVDIRVNAPAVGITHLGQKINGVNLENGEHLPARIVVMNGDASDAPGLLGEAGAKPLPEERRSLSGFWMLLGLNRKLPDLHHHTVFFSADYHREFLELFEARRFPEDPTVYVNIPSRTDPSCAPDGGEALFIMANAPANAAAWNDARAASARERVFNRLQASGFPDIADAIVIEDIWTPKRAAERYRMPGGAIYGQHSHGWRNAFMRPPNVSSRYSGLYFAGGSTHPGGGTPIVLRSAEITTRLIAKREGSP